MTEHNEYDLPPPPDLPSGDAQAVPAIPSAAEEPASGDAVVARWSAVVGFICSCGFLMLPVLVYLSAAAGVTAWGWLWTIPIVLPLPGLAFSITASKRRDHLDRGLDVLTSIGVGLGWVGVAVVPIGFVVLLITLSSW